MSSPRLLLVSGPAGAGSSSIARALASASPQAVLIRSDDPAGELRVVLSGIEPLLGELLAPPSLLRSGEGLLAVAGVGAADPIVWDAGPIDELLTALAALEALAGLVDRLTAPLLTHGIGIPAERIAAARSVITRLDSAQRRLREPTSGLILVDEPSDGLAARIRRARARGALLGLAVDLVIVNRVPRKREDWPGPWAAARRRTWRSLRTSHADLPICAVPWFTSGDIDRRIAKRLPAAASIAAQPIAAPSTEAQGDGYLLRVPVPDADPAAVRAGRLGDALVVEVEGIRRLLPLDAVLARCAVDGGGLVGDDLVIRFRPDPQQWPVAS